MERPPMKQNAIEMTRLRRPKADDAADKHLTIGNMHVNSIFRCANAIDIAMRKARAIKRHLS